MEETMKEQIDKNAFNMDASFKDKTVIQSAIDNLFESRDETTDIPMEKEGVSAKMEAFNPEENQEENKEQYSNDDIDALFSGAASTAPNGGTSTQDDIDALFSGSKKTAEKQKEHKTDKPDEKSDEKKRKETSQEEIDKLFG